MDEAEKLALPNEDPDEIQGRADQWQAACPPATPGTLPPQQAVKASLSLDRCRDQQTAAIARQVREAPRAWDNERQDELERLKALLTPTPPPPPACCGGRPRLPLGLRALGPARGDPRDRGLVRPDRAEAIRLLGFRPETTGSRGRRRRSSCGCSTCAAAQPSARALEWLCEPAGCPSRSSRSPAPSSSRAGHLPEGAAQHHRRASRTAEELEEALRRELDEPDRAEAATRALIPLEEKSPG